MASNSATASAELIAAIRARQADFTAAGDRAEAERNLPADTIRGTRWTSGEMASLAGKPALPPDGLSLAERPVFQSELGRAETRLPAARAAHREAVAATWAAALAGEVPPNLHTDLTVASVFAAETCADVIGSLFRYGGGRLLARSELMQRLLRDVLAARQHIGLSEEAYERAGRERIAARS